MEKTIKQFMSLLIKAEAYQALFKGGVVLLGLALLSFANYATDLYQFEKEAYESKFHIEAKYSVNDIKEINCLDLKEATEKSECKYAQYQFESVSSFASIIDTFFNIFKGLGILFLIWSFGAFILHLWRGGEEFK